MLCNQPVYLYPSGSISRPLSLEILTESTVCALCPASFQVFLSTELLRPALTMNLGSVRAETSHSCCLFPSWHLAALRCWFRNVTGPPSLVANLVYTNKTCGTPLITFLSSHVILTSGVWTLTLTAYIPVPVCHCLPAYETGGAASSRFRPGTVRPALIPCAGDQTQ